MKKNIAMVTAVIAAMIFSACGDDSNSASSEQENTDYSSGAIIDDGRDDNGERDSHRSHGVEGDRSPAEQSSSSALTDKGVSSSEDYSWALQSDFDWTITKESIWNPDAQYDSFVDKRDGKVYRSVKIGGQIWMAENLNYSDSVKTPLLNGKMWCFKNDAKNCELAGRMYSWDVATEICPEGWHLPSIFEWKVLAVEAGGLKTGAKALKSRTGWASFYRVARPGQTDFDGPNGSDVYGFSAMPFGLRDYNGVYDFDGYTALFWTSAQREDNPEYAFHADMKHEDSSVFIADFSTDIRMGLSVRCINDLSVNPDTSRNWRWDVSKEDLLNPEIKYDSFTDPRDGQVYKTVKIGDQIWMAQNLNYWDTLAMPLLKQGSLCYDGDSLKCQLMGRYYEWSAVIDSVGLATDEEDPINCGSEASCNFARNVQGVCPPEWHLPSLREWKTLIDFAGGEFYAGIKLKSKRGWNYVVDEGVDGNGLDTYGFSAFPSGVANHSDGKKVYRYLGETTGFWSITPLSVYEIRLLTLHGDYEGLFTEHSATTYKSYHPVRCLKD